jgi:hypothetical protein
MGNAPVRASVDGERPQRIRGGKVEIALLKNGVGDLETQPITTPSATAQPADQSSSDSYVEPETPAAEPATGTTPTPPTQQNQPPPALPSPR